MRFGWGAWLGAVLGFWVLGCGTLRANDVLPWEKDSFSSTPQELLAAVKDVPVDENLGATVMLEERRYRIKADGSMDWTQRWMYVVQSPDAVESWSKTETSWAPWFEARPVMKVRVVNTDGSEAWLAEENIVEIASEANANIYTDRRRLAAPFPQVQVGSVIEEVITTQGERPFFAAGTSGSWLGQGGVAQLRRVLVVDVEDGARFRYKTLNLDLEPMVEKKAGFTRYSFIQKDVPEREPGEYGLPFDRTSWSLLEFSTGESWQEMAAAYQTMVQEALEGESFEWVDSALKVEGKPFETAVKLVHWLNAKVRYTGWELGESALRPTTPKLCLERGYGDCKDKAVLVVGMLRKLGFTAHVALLRSGTDYDVHPELPGMGRFNHAIVAIQDGSETQWIDPTDEFSRDGSMHFSNQGRRALIASSKTKELVTIPESKDSDNLAREVRTYTFVDNEGGKVQENTTYTGQFESSMRISYQGYNDEKLAERLEAYATDNYRNAKITRATKTVSEDLSKPFQMKMELGSVGRLVVEDFTAAIAVMHGDALAYVPDILMEEAEEDTPARKDPYVFSYPHTYSIQYQIQAPAGFEWKKDPQDETVELGSGSYRIHVRETEPGTVMVDLEFRSGPRTISAETFTNYRDDLKKFTDRSPLILSFTHRGMVLKEAGKVTESMAVFRELATQHANDPGHLRHYANALKEAGLVERAIEIARQICELEPESADAFYELGNLLQLDPLGRRRNKGYDREGAVQAYLKAIELDSQHKLARGELAILYEFDEDGGRYTAKTNLDKALEQYQYLRENFEDLDLESNIRANLVASRSYEQLVKETEDEKDLSEKETYRALALMDKEGLKAGVAQVESLTDNETRQETAVLLAELLMKQRDYVGVSTFLRIAAKGSPNARELEGRAQILEKITVFDPDAVQKSLKPEDVVKSAIYAMVDLEGKGKEGLKEYFEAEYLTAGHENSEHELANLKQIFQVGSRMLDLSVEVFLDLILSIAKLSTEGDEVTGYRVEMRLEGTGAKSKHYLFLAKQNGKLMVVADDQHSSFIAKYALGHLNQGNVEAGKKWLEWFVDAAGGASMNPNSLAPSFRQIWNKGDADHETRMKLMAAAAILHETFDATAYQVLSEGLDTLEGKAREAAEISLAYGDQEREEHAKAYSVFVKMLERYPSDIDLLISLGDSVLHLDQWTEYDAALEVVMKNGSKDDLFFALMAKAEILMFQGKHQQALDAYLKVSEISEGYRLVYNQLAWLSLFLPGYEEKGQEWIEKAVGGQGGSYSTIHTLATFYAEQGRCLEAKNTLLKVIETENLSVIKPGDWYVWGRMAEHYGEIEIAQTYYHRVKEDNPKTAMVSTKALAERRLALLKQTP